MLSFLPTLPIPLSSSPSPLRAHPRCVIRPQPPPHHPPRRASSYPPTAHAPITTPLSSPLSPGRGRVLGGLSVEFLGVAGGLATLIGVVLLPLPAFLLALRGAAASSTAALTPAGAGLPAVAIMSAAYGLVLSRFDLDKLPRLRLTMAFVLATRFFCVPVLAHSLSCLANIVLTGGIAGAAAGAGATAAAGASGAGSGILSSMLLLALAPVGYSPSVAMLSPYMYPTLFAHLTFLTMLCFPALPMISYGVNMLLRRTSVFGAAPLVAPPPGAWSLLAATTLPLLCTVIASRRLPRRWVAVAGLFALPTAWACAAVLGVSALLRVVASGFAGFGGSVVMCGGIVSVMALLGRVLSRVLGLDVRAERTLVLYLSSQGSTVSAGFAPGAAAAAPSAAAALLGIILAYVFSRRWSKVIVRTAEDHL